MNNLAHISQTFIDVPYDVAWAGLSNPTQFPKLYPNWTEHVTVTAEGKFQAVAPAPAGDQLEIVPHLDHASGVLDFAIVDEQGRVEWSRSRLFALRPSGCVLIHVAVRADVAHLADLYGQDEETFWHRYTRGVDADFEHARHVLVGD